LLLKSGDPQLEEAIRIMKAKRGKDRSGSN